MAQQKSEDRVVPQGRRKAVPTRVLERRGGGKAVSVKGVDPQLSLALATAESPRRLRGAEGAAVPDRSGSKARKEPKAKDKRRRAGPARIIRLGVKPRTAWRR